MPSADLLEEIIDLVRADAQMVGCLVEVKRARDIVASGTSAHHQVAIYEEAKSDGLKSEWRSPRLLIGRRFVIEHQISL